MATSKTGRGLLLRESYLTHGDLPGRGFFHNAPSKILAVVVGITIGPEFPIFSVGLVIHRKSP
jgi:hypothetical protein